LEKFNDEKNDIIIGDEINNNLIKAKDEDKKINDMNNIFEKINLNEDSKNLITLETHNNNENNKKNKNISFNENNINLNSYNNNNKITEKLTADEYIECDGFIYDKDGKIIEDEKLKEWKDQYVDFIISKNNLNLQPKYIENKPEIEISNFDDAEIYKKESKCIKENNKINTNEKELFSKLKNPFKIQEINEIIFNTKNEKINSSEKDYIDNYLTIRNILIEEGFEDLATTRQIDEIYNLLFNEEDEENEY